MKKLKLLPLLTVATIGGSILPITVSCNKEKEPDEPVVNEYKVEFVNCKGIEVPETKKIQENKQYKVTIKAKDSYILVESITVKVDGDFAPTDYYSFDVSSDDNKSGTLTIPKVTANTTITIEGVIPEPGKKLIGEVEWDIHDSVGVEIIKDEQQDLIYDTLKVGDKFEVSLVDVVDINVCPDGKYGFGLHKYDNYSESVEIIKDSETLSTGIKLYRDEDYSIEITDNYTHVTFTLLSIDKFKEDGKFLENFKLHFGLDVIEAYIHMSLDAYIWGPMTLADYNLSAVIFIGTTRSDPIVWQTIATTPADVPLWLSKKESLDVIQSVTSSAGSTDSNWYKFGFVVELVEMEMSITTTNLIGNGSFIKRDGSNVSWIQFSEEETKYADRRLLMCIDDETIGHEHHIHVETTQPT